MVADIVIDDRDDRPLGLVQVKAKVATSEQIEDWRHRLDRSHRSILFGILADPETIWLFKRERGTFASITDLKAREVLGHYAPDFAGSDTRYGSIQFFREYLETLVSAWLRDFAYHWKSESPPGTADLAGTGLLEGIEGGFAASRETMKRLRARRV